LLPERSPFGVLLNPDAFHEFTEALTNRRDVTHAWIVTDDAQAFARMRSQIKRRIRVGMLYNDLPAEFHHQYRPERMNLVLKDFQTEAVESLHQQLADARKRAANGKLEAITLSAPTGSGKTVILTRLIELALEGDEDHHADPDAVFLWVTDQPELNIQTRDKMQSTSHVLTAANTVEITADFDEEVFPAGRVFFLNTQKLGTGSSWVKTGDNRTFTLWDTIRNTVNTRPGGFFVIIDEAHRGTKLDKGKAEEANSIMQKFLLGSDDIPPVPLIIGISATLDRFTDLLHAAAKAKKARIHQPVDIDPADVIASGLLKSEGHSASSRADAWHAVPTPSRRRPELARNGEALDRLLCEPARDTGRASDSPRSGRGWRQRKDERDRP
jgi:hypothetical protein